jgi:hypothetical protein
VTLYFEDSDYYTGPPINPDMVSRAEAVLAVRLPTSYVRLLANRNGGVPHARCFPTDFATSWAADYIEISAILGIGGAWGIDAEIGGSINTIREWGYPDIGVVVCRTPSGGHDAVMLDYSGRGRLGEPAVAYIDEDRVPRLLAPTFAAFINGLAICPPPPDA